ncbi:MAG: hydrogenase maturation nickel metallochaperone HypA [Treponemataceae bacterium]
MHELGVVLEVLRTVEDVMKENGLTKVQTIVLQIGELSSMVPRYVQECFPAAADGTVFEDTELRIEVLPANARCAGCGMVYPVVPGGGACPRCGGDRKELLSGREFLVKEIVAC